MIKIFGSARSRTTRATWAAEEAQIGYEFVHVDMSKGDHQKPAFKSINPLGKVPALVDGDLVLTESAAICTYIGNQAPQKELVPQDPKARARYDKWCFFVIGELEQPLWTIAKHKFALPKEYRVSAVCDTARFEFKKVLKVLSVELADKKYLIDNKFTMADVLVAHTLAWAMTAKQEINYDNIKQYSERLLGRPALAVARAKEAGE